MRGHPLEKKPRRASFLPHNSVIVVLVAQSLSDYFAIPWTVAHQAPLSMGFSGQEYWSGFPFPPPGDLPDPTSLAITGKFFTTEPPGKSVSVYT